MSLKNILFTSCLFLLIANCNAQKFSFGASAGVLASQFDGDKLFGFKKIGLLTGLNWYYNVDEKQQIQFDIDYMNIGSKYDGEPRPVNFKTKDFTLLEVNIHAVSLFVGYNWDFMAGKNNATKFKASLGMRLSRAFSFKTYTHNAGRAEIELNPDNLQSTFFGPEARIGTYINDRLSFSLISSVGINNMMLNEEKFISVLRPFYIGIASSYLIKPYKHKKIRGRKRR